MIEPYAAISFPMNTSPNVDAFPFFGLGGGVQFAVKFGNSGGFFLDVNFIYFLGDVVMKQPNSFYKETQETYSRFTIGLGLGYKFGLFDRPKRKIPVK